MNKKYATILNTRPFLYKESKTVAEWKLNELSDEEIKEKIIEDNSFQLNSIDRRKRFYSEINKRLSFLDDYLLEQLVQKDTQTSKVLLLLAIIKRDRLFYEWMREVVWDKWLILDYQVSRSETAAFINRKAEQDETISKWKFKTRELLVSAYHKTLVDAEMAVPDENKINLHKIFIDSSVRNYLIENEETHYVEVLLGEMRQ